MGRKKRNSVVEVELSKRAKIQIEEIINYVAVIQKRPLTAEKLRGKMYRKLLEIGHNPYAYRLNTDLSFTKSEVRQVSYLSWTITFEVFSDKVVIRDIIHRSRNLLRDY